MKKSFQRVIATLNLFQGKQSLTIFLLAAFFALWGCDDSSSATEDNNETSAVESSSSTSAINKGKSSESKTGDEISSSDEQDTGDTREYSSSSRKTSSKSESSSSVEVSSSSSFPVVDCEREGAILSMADGTSFVCKDGFLVPYSSSSKITLSSSSNYPVMDSVFNSELSYGEFEDPRDHQVYKTRTLTLSNGQKIEVFAQNLNYGKFLKEGDEIIEGDTIKFCYDDDEWYCDNFYGGQYTWAGVMGFPYACNDHKTNTVECPFILDADDYGRQYRGICPEGWHITNKREWAVGIVGGRGSLSVSKASGGVDAAGLSILLRNNYASWFLPSVLDGNLQENDTHAQVLKFSIETGEFGYVRKGAEITGKYVPDSKHRSIVGVRCTRDYVYEN